MSCLWEGSCFVCGRVHVLFVGLFMSCLWVCSCLIVLWCVVFSVCFSSSCVPYVSSFSGLSIFDCPFDIL
jgi:hypothetical protein